jgi:uncharacterized protein (TIGR03663 family)
MVRLGITIGWLLVAGISVWLRFDNLGARPMHADEATGARIAASRMSGEGGAFDPRHYHGPLLGDVATVVCQLRGEAGWKELTQETLRSVPAVAGTCVVLLPWFWRGIVGHGGALLAALVLSLSPLLVYYSRMFIHEMLLVVAGGAFLACWVGPRARPLWAGVCLGLMFAVKETFVISLMAWGGAWMATMLCGGRWKNVHDVLAWGKSRITHAAWTVGAATAVSLACYTRWGAHPLGAWHAVETFFVYETVAGHEKPWWWYLRWLGWPEKSAGQWWFECVVLWWAMLLWLISFLPVARQGAGRDWLRFLGFAFLGHLIVYSCFGYKTPWLMCVPWMHVCWMAGFGVTLLRSPVWRAAAAGVVVLGVAVPMIRLTSLANHRLASDVRNPYAYVPTRADVEALEMFFHQLRPLADQNILAVVGSDYWPLPWYLRSFDRVGYWAQAPVGLADWPFVLVMPEEVDRVTSVLHRSHMALPRALRPEVPLWLMVRNDIWKRWTEDDT